MNHLYLSANQTHQTRSLGVWKFLWAVNLIFSAFLTQAQPCSTSIDFSSPIATGSTQAPNTWYTDRYAPAGFTAPSSFNGSDRLKHSIAIADGAATRPSGQQTTFYNTQGRQLDLINGVKSLEIKLYIPSAWASSKKRMAGLWGTATDASNAISAYPIIEFTSDDNNPRFRGYESGAGAWVDLGLPAGFTYDQWVTLKIRLLSSGEFQYTVVTSQGNLQITTTTNAPDASKQIANTILQGYNYNPDQPLDETNTGIAYDIYWDDFSAKVTDNLVTNTTTNKTFCSIQAAIDDATTLDGQTLVVGAGTYTENVLVNKALTINGPNAGIPGAGSRSTEAILSDGSINVTSTGNVVIDGFHIYQTNGTGDVVLLGGNSTVTIQNSKFERVGTVAGQSVRAITTSAGSGAKTIQNNLFTGPTGGNLFSTHKTWNSGIYVNGAGSTVNISGNTFENVRSALNLDDYNAGITISGNTFKLNGTHLSFGGSIPTSGAYILGSNEFKTPASGIVNLSNVDNTFRLDITSSTFNGAAFSTYPLATLFLIESAMTHRGRVSSGIPRNGLVTYVAGQEYVVAGLTTIQSAVNYSNANDIIHVSNGTYNETLTVTKNLTFEGANKDVCGTGTRSAETILVAPATETGAITLSGSVTATFNGFLVDGLGVAYLTQANQGLVLKNSVFELDFLPGKNNLYAASTALTLECNYFKAMGGTNDGGSSSHIFVGNGSLTATNNTFTSEAAAGSLTGATTSLPVWLNLTANTSRFSVLNNLFTKIDIGILLAANAGGGVIQTNEFSEAKRNNPANGYGTGIAIFGNYTPATPVSILNNKFYNGETGIRTSTGDASNNFPAPSLLTISSNSFETLSAGSFRIGGAYNGSPNALNATCNWFSNAPVITGNPANITYAPLLTSGTDNEPNTIGFQTTAPCLAPVHNLTHPKDFATIQAANDDPITVAGDIIQADNGTHNEDVVITKAIILQGESRNGTILKGLLKDNTKPAVSAYTLIINADDVTVKNITVTRDYNGDQAGWNASQKNYGLTIENKDRLTVDNVLVKDNRNGIFLHNTKNTVVKNSEIVANRTGFQVFGPLDNTQIINNFITGNFTHGFLFNFDQGPTSAPGMKISNNNISGNWYTQISFQKAAATPAANVGDFSTLDLSCNWYGAVPTATVGTVSVPGYTDQTTSQFGGMAPATTLYIAGEEAAGKNFVPYLNNGTDNESGTAGFQPVPNSCVSPIQNLTHQKYFGTIQAAINDPITVAGDVIKIDAGTYTENFTVTKNLTFEGANKDVCGTATRSAETILIAPATPTGVITLSSSVTATFNGFKIDGLGVAYLTQANQSLTVKNSLFELDFSTGQNNLYSASAAVTLDCNYFKAIGGTNDTGGASHIFIGDGTFTATNNKFTSETAVVALTGATTSLPVWLNLTANTSRFSVLNNLFTKIDIGILLAANAGGGVIQNNEFSEAKRAAYTGGSSYGTGIAIFGTYTPATPVSILNNKFYNGETGIRTSTGDASNSFPAPSLLTISSNSFETLSAGSFRIGGAYNGSPNALNATCNWFSNAPVVTGNPANITYLPKLVSGTDESQAIGFQTSAACLLPVYNVTKNTYFATIQAAISDAGTTNGDEILASDGTYNERVTVSKQVKLTGASKAGTIIDGAGLAGTGSGIFINDGITNVTIKNFTIQNFTGSSGNLHAGIYANAGNNNLTITDVVIKNNPSASGIYANGPVSDVLIDKVDALNNGPTARGIVIWNGLKKNITITNSNVQNNICCGIELQDGSATGVLIKGNTIVGNDNAIGLVGLTSGSGLGKANIIENNTITVNGRFGIEVKNPNGTGRDVDTEDGAIIIRSNTVTFGSTTDQRDLAGIAVYRRGVLAGNVDVPTGVVVKNNTVSGFKQPSTSDGFGIVIEGTNHTVTGNTLNNNDVGIQLQAGYGGYPGDGNQDNLADTYFGRGNSPLTCGNTVAPNTFSGNAANTRDVGSSAGGGTVMNINTNKTFCSIQSAINDPTTLNGHTITVGAGTYNEEVTVSKSLTLTGANVGIAGNGSRGAEAVVDGNIGTHGGFVVTVSNVTIDGFRINGAAGTYGAGVYSSPTTSGLVLQNNVISDNAIGAYPSSNGASWVKRNLFVANNRPGSAGGAGIYVEATNALTIDGNEFRGHTNNSAVILAATAPNAHQNLVFTNNNVHDNNNANSMVYLSGVNSATISSNTVVQSGTTAIKVAGGNANISLINNVLNGNTTAIKVQNDGVGPNTGVQATNNSLVSTKSVDNQDVNNVTLTCNFYGVTSYVDVLAKLSAGSTGKNLLNSIATTNTYSSCLSPAGLALVGSSTATCVGSPSSVTATGLLASTSTVATYVVNDGTPQTYTATTTAAGELIISVVIPAGPYTLRVTSLEANGTVTTINPPLSVTGMVQTNVVAGTVSGAASVTIGNSTTYTNTGGTPGGTWSSSNPAIATVDNAGLVTGVASGTANIIYTVTGCGGPVSSSATITVRPLPDLTMTMNVLPSIVYGNGNFSVVVDVIEIRPVPTTGTISVFIAKDSKSTLTFNPTATMVGIKTVQNSSWTFDNSNDSFYILTTNQTIGTYGNVGTLSFGLTGTALPPYTKGSGGVSATIPGGSGGDANSTNNTSAVQIEFFK